MLSFKYISITQSEIISMQKKRKISEGTKYLNSCTQKYFVCPKNLPLPQLVQ